jgi:peroxiredoxin
MNNNKKINYKLSRLWRISLQALLIVAIIVGVNLWRTRDAASGRPPPLVATTLEGAHFDIKEYLGKPLFVHFWAEWCPICSLEEDSIQSLSRDYEMITVAMSSGDDEAVRAHMKERGLSFKVINDESGQIAAEWGVQAVPATFVIDAAGEIRFVEMGYSSRLGLMLRHWLVEKFAVGSLQ